MWPKVEGLVGLVLGHLGEGEIVLEGVFDEHLHGGVEGLSVVADQEGVVGLVANGVDLCGQDVDADVLEDLDHVHEEPGPVLGGDAQDRVAPRVVLVNGDLGLDAGVHVGAQGAGPVPGGRHVVPGESFQ